MNMSVIPLRNQPDKTSGVKILKKKILYRNFENIKNVIDSSLSDDFLRLHVLFLF